MNGNPKKKLATWITISVLVLMALSYVTNIVFEIQKDWHAALLFGTFTAIIASFAFRYNKRSRRTDEAKPSGQ